jgi:hypothetical protein
MVSQWLEQRESDSSSATVGAEGADIPLPHEHDVERVVALYMRADDLLNNVNNSAELVKVCRLVLLVRCPVRPIRNPPSASLVFLACRRLNNLRIESFDFSLHHQLPYEGTCQKVFAKACIKLFDLSRKPTNDVFFHQESLFDPLLMVLQHAQVYSFEEVSYGMFLQFSCACILFAGSFFSVGCKHFILCLFHTIFVCFVTT